MMRKCKSKRGSKKYPTTSSLIYFFRKKSLPLCLYNKLQNALFGKTRRQKKMVMKERFNGLLVLACDFWKISMRYRRYKWLAIFFYYPFRCRVLLKTNKNVEYCNLSERNRSKAWSQRKDYTITKRILLNYEHTTLVSYLKISLVIDRTFIFHLFFCAQVLSFPFFFSSKRKTS